MMSWFGTSRLQRYRDVVEDVSLQTLWKLRGISEARPHLTWELDAERLAHCMVRWPSRYEWAPAEKWVAPLRHGFERLVRVAEDEIAQPYQGIVMLEITSDGETLPVAVDYHDHAEVNAECAERVSLYFKMQHAEEGYPWPHVYAGGFVPGGSLIYSALPQLRGRRERGDFAFDVYGRFGLEFASGIRRRAVEMLSGQNSFRYEGGAARIRYSRYLREIAASKICIDLPGNGDFCFRLVDYLAIGACIISARPGNRMHVPLVEGEHIVYAKPDLSDLVDLCRSYVENDEARERLCRNSRTYFDRYLHRDQLAAYYLHCCLTREES